MRNTVSTLLFLVFILVSCQSESEQQIEGYANPELLAEAGWLQENIASESLKIVDMRNDPEGEFIPGAIYFGGVPALMDPNHPVESFLKGANDFAQVMSENGLSQEDQIIIYDEGNSLRSARLFLALEYYGHPNVRILNGGLEAWKATGGALANESAQTEETEFTVTMNEAAICDMQTVLDAIDDENTVIVDARPSDQYSGETVRAERGGHIPGSVNLYWEEMISDEGVPTFKPAEEIRAIYEAYGITPDKRIITHCHSNMQASNAYFVLRLMGYTNISSYEGSWSEYGNTPDVPVEM
jgi:thiosulfate/3-mercaptopyruvate sulfurtransferase